MLKPSDRLAPNANQVASEVIDGEAIIINLVSGIYYSMERVGGVIWAMVEAGHRLEEIVTAIVGRYDVSVEQAEADVHRVAAELIEHRLVVPSNRDVSDRLDAEPAPATRLPYHPPRLTVYRDMGDLLALDPPAPGLKDIPWGPSASGPRE